MRCETRWDYAGYRAELLAGKKWEWAVKGILDRGTPSGAHRSAGGCGDLGGGCQGLQ